VNEPIAIQGATPDPASIADRSMPALYLGHGAPPLLEDPEWMGQLNGWAAGLPKPKSILIVSAHWQTAPMAISATRPAPLVYDFYGFPQHYYDLRYAAPGAPDLAAKVKGLMPSTEPVLERESRGLDHGAFSPLSLLFDHKIGWPTKLVPLAVGVPAMALATPLASVTPPLVVPPMTAASFMPLMVTVTTWAVPSAVVTVKVSVRVWPTFSACTAALALFRV